VNHSKLDTGEYSVSIVIDERTHHYPFPGSSHQQALEKAFAAHEQVRGSVPMAAYCVVFGPWQ
jgi:hypothetical protein